MQEPLPITIETSRRRSPRPQPGRRPVPDWRIDARTRRLGLMGVAQARAALAASRRQGGDDGQPDAA